MKIPSWLKCSLKCILICFFPGNHCLNTFAQHTIYEVHSIPLEGDLANFSGTCMLQDREGFMWFGSMDGLYRYDGRQFIKYQAIPGDPNSLTRNEVTCIMEDRDGMLWIGTEMGLTSFDKMSGRFTQYLNKNDTSSFESKCIQFLLEDQAGTFWVATRAGIHRFNKNIGKFTSFTPDNPYSKNSNPWIWYLFEDSFGVLWLQDGPDGLSIFNRITETFEYVKDTPADLNALYEDSFGRFWIASWDGLYQFDRQTHVFNRVLYQPEDPNHLTNQMVRCIIEDDDHNIWIRTYDGIYQYSQNLELITGWKNDQNYTRSPAYYNLCKYLFLDKSGSLWNFSNSDISIIASNDQVFNVYDPEPSTNSFVSGLHIADRNIVWFTYGDNEIVKLDRYTEKYTRYRIDPQDSINFRQDLIGSYLHVDRNGQFWILHSNGGLDRIAFSGTYTFQIVSSIYFQDNLDNLREIVEDQSGRLWLGPINKNLSCYDPENERIKLLVNNPESVAKLPVDNNIRTYIDSDTFIAVGENKIYRIILPLVPVNDSTVMPTDVIEIKPETSSNLNFGPTALLRTYRNGEEIIWISTWEKGLLKITVNTSKKSGLEVFNLEHYTTQQGLINNQVTTMLEDKQGNLWLGTNYGLSKFNPSTETFINFTRKDGLPINHIRYGSARKSRTGEFFFGTAQGFFSFYPDSIFVNPYIPPVVITGFKIFNETESTTRYSNLDSSIEPSEVIHLSFNNNYISFNYAALNYIQPERNQYRYKMEGFNTDWINAGNRTYADYMNLKPGKYRFRVIGSNNEGVWNEEGASLNFIIHPPPWKKWWAYLVYSVILILTVLTYRRNLLHRAKLRTELEVERIQKEKGLELNQMKTRFFTNISHEFRTPLTLLLGPLEDILSSNRNKIEADRSVFELMKRNARRLQRLINQLLDISRLDTGKMTIKASEGDIANFVRTITGSFHSLAESKKIEYQVRLPGEKILCFFDPDKLEKILTNLLSNAFKYTSKEGTVILELEYLDPTRDQAPLTAVIKVKDTGRGISKDRLSGIFDRFSLAEDTLHREDDSMGIGLSLTKELVELLKGTISVKSEIGKGTEFIVSLPVSAENYSEEERIESAVYSEPEPIHERKSGLPKMNGHTPDLLTKFENISRTEVLVVEDNEDLRRYICDKLESEYQMIEAGNGLEGVRVSMDKLPDLVISDLLMPEKDGLELCRELKNDPRTCHIPIILLTAKSEKRSKLDGLESGADDYIVKPFDAEELQVRVRNLTSLRRRLKERFQNQLLDPKFTEIPNGDGDQLIRRLLESFEDNYYDYDFNVNEMGKEMLMSRAQFYRKVNALTGTTPNELLRMFRIKKAVSLIESSDLNITAIMYEVGFRSTSHFAETFRKHYGMNPSEYRGSLTCRN